jgi:hypothetical protein
LNKLDAISKHLSSRSAAILSATFAEVLFLDIDSFLVRDPDYLFQSDPMYHRFGALFFPDARTSKHPSVIWKLLNITCTSNELDFDSRTLLVNKKRVWNALYMAKLISDQYDFSEAYKDTFRLAFRFMRVAYYMVGIPCSVSSIYSMSIELTFNFVYRQVITIVLIFAVLPCVKQIVWDNISLSSKKNILRRTGIFFFFFFYTIVI